MSDYLTGWQREDRTLFRLARDDRGDMVNQFYAWVSGGQGRPKLTHEELERVAELMRSAPELQAQRDALLAAAKGAWDVERMRAQESTRVDGVDFEVALSGLGRRLRAAIALCEEPEWPTKTDEDEAAKAAWHALTGE